MTALAKGNLFRLLIIIAVLAAVIMLGGPVPTVQAATITVDGTTCTLADAITAANTDTATGGCTAGSGADTLNLLVDVTLTSALPQISSPITIEGNGNTIARDGAASAFRILDVTGGGNLTVNKTTITGGSVVGDGGGIYVSCASSTSCGSLAITNSIIEKNEANPTGALGNGGGICFEGTGVLSITDSTIRNNMANGFSGGGGLFYYNDQGVQAGPVTISGSTFSGNTSTYSFADGGGINLGGDSTAGTVTANISNSTFSGNSTQGRGGGLFMGASDNAGVTLAVNIDSSTFTGNTVGSGTVENTGPNIGVVLGVDEVTAQVDLTNTILDGGCGNYFAANADVFTSLGHNLSSAAAGTSCILTQPTDLPNTNPQLGPLQDNGGPTQTHALLTGSPAIDAGDTTLITDQRGIARPQGTTDDIGAVEIIDPTAVSLYSFRADGADFAMIGLGLLATVGLLVATGYILMYRRRA